ncbi:MAG: amino acid adenylation domain-containing protein, partial [Kofleriaceae bacterium]|nr:amino acid adenylation domain-containing protein [Kofleriaceae bacterium]
VETDALIGYFLNTVVLRANLGGSPSFAALLDQVRDVALGAYAHQDAPFDQVVEALRVPRTTGRSPLFQVMFVHQRAGDEAAATWGPSLAEEPVTLGGRQMAKFELTLNVLSHADGVTCAIEANAALFDAATLERMLGHYERLLGALAAEPGRAIDAVTLLAESEQAQLVEWNATAREYPRDTLVHEQFEHQVERAPDAVAVVFEDTAMTYRELDERANALAHRLIAEGVLPGDYVATLLERGIGLVIAQLGILKAGAAYVPMDVQAPSERHAWMMADCHARVVISDGERAVVAGATVVRIESVVGRPDKPTVARAATDVAYVIYTSGSTGHPKGVMVTHRGISRLVHSPSVAVEAADRVAWLGNPAFDLSTYEVWAPLVRGACLVVISTEEALHGLRDVIERRALTVLHLTAGLFHQIVEGLGAGLGRLRMLLMGGDVVDPQVVRRMRAHARKVVHCYGPTETTTFATTYEVGEVDAGCARLPIGRPIGNTQVYVLDAHQQPVPIGVIGELYIGGDGVARGYLNQPALTAERFLADPFRGEPSARMYRTGDLARYLPDGNLEFLGRNDHQVKIRGYRIELGEIEAVVAAHASVREVTVLAREDQPGDKVLVAYVVGRDGAPDLEALRTHTSASLPGYMVPSTFVVLEAFPLTRNGKLDRKALPAPDAMQSKRAYEAPQGALEELLAQIWRELLRLEQVGRNDNFFELGGHSLLAIRLLAQLRRRGWTVEVRTLFATPSLGALAATMRSHHEVTVPPNAIGPGSATITPDQLPLIQLTQAEIDRIGATIPGGLANVQDIYSLTPLQEGMLFHHQLAPEQDPYVIVSRVAFPSRGMLDRYLAGVRQVIKRHDSLRTAFVWEGLSKPAQVVLRTARLQVTELARLDELEHGAFDLTQAPLLQYVIAPEPGTARWVMVQLMHHLISDHESLEMMWSEVAQVMEGREAELPAPYPFRNVVAAATLGKRAEAHEEYFRTLLGDIDEPSTAFGLDEAHLDGTEIVEASQMLTPALAARLRMVARQFGASVASLCHAAWGRIVARTSGRTQAVFGTVLFGRMQVSSSSAFGLYLNTLPMRLDLDDISVADAVRRAHAVLAELMEHEHAPLSLAQRCSGVAPPAPLFTSLLNYRHSAGEGDAAAASPFDGMEWLGGEDRTNYPLTISVDDDGTRLNLSVQVAASVSGARVCAMFARALEHLATLLEQAPHTPIRDLDILPAEERAQLAQWNSTVRDYPQDVCLHALFEQQVDRTPNAVAVVFEDSQLTYAELDRRANQLAHHLRARGVGPDVLVALCVERSLDMIVGILGILKAGGAYVPLDPSYPAERLAFTVEDAAPAVVVAHAELISALPSTRAHIVRLDEDAELLAREPAERLAPASSFLDLAYIIYTSGSTGRPKGVMITHGNATRLFAATEAWYGFSERDVWTLFHSYAFDFSVWEIWGALLYGGRLVVVPHQTTRSPDEFRALLAAEGVTVLNQTPSAFYELIRADAEAQTPLALRLIIFGGEALSFAKLGPWFERHGDQAPVLVNMYGITETTVHVTYRPLVADDVRSRANSAIGEAIADLTLYVLDQHLELVPIGVAGELFVGGAGLARGYLNRPELTAERFIVNPFGPGRLYRTGDLARWLPDGELDYLGRIDHQVKIRGFRIELGEIEAVLAAHATVREVVVLAREDVPGDKRL